MSSSKFYIITPEEYFGGVKKVMKEVLEEHEKGKLVTPFLESNAVGDILTINQAAEFLNLSRHTIYGYVNKKIIPFIKKSKKLYFRKIDLQNWLIEGRQKTQKELGEEAIKDIVRHKKKNK